MPRGDWLIIFPVLDHWPDCRLAPFGLHLGVHMHLGYARCVFLYILGHSPQSAIFTIYAVRFELCVRAGYYRNQLSRSFWPSPCISHVPSGLYMLRHANDSRKHHAARGIDPLHDLRGGSPCFHRPLRFPSVVINDPLE